MWTRSNTLCSVFVLILNSHGKTQDSGIIWWLFVTEPILEFPKSLENFQHDEPHRHRHWVFPADSECLLLLFLTCKYCFWFSSGPHTKPDTSLITGMFRDPVLMTPRLEQRSQPLVHIHIWLAPDAQKHSQVHASLSWKLSNEAESTRICVFTGNTAVFSDTVVELSLRGRTPFAALYVTVGWVTSVKPLSLPVCLLENRCVPRDPERGRSDCGDPRAFRPAGERHNICCSDLWRTATDPGSLCERQRASADQRLVSWPLLHCGTSS